MGFSCILLHVHDIDSINAGSEWGSVAFSYMSMILIALM